MNYYIYKNKVESFDRDLRLTNDVSTDFNDLQKNYFIELDEEQIAFYLENPTLSVVSISFHSDFSTQRVSFNIL